MALVIMHKVNKYLALAMFGVFMALKELIVENGENILDFEDVKELDLTTVKDKEK